jgi:hypothetical protein
MMLANHPIFFVIAVAVIAPFLSEIRIGARIPVVVLEEIKGTGGHVLKTSLPTAPA